jgi:hypothetical protein
MTKTSNKVMERTATRFAFALCVTKPSSLRATLALGGRRSACSRQMNNSPTRSTLRAWFALQLFADNRDEKFSMMWRAAMFKEKNALPGAELHSSLGNRYCLAGAC